MQFKPLYTFLGLYIPPVFRLYYKKYQVNNQKNIPAKGPLIFAPNHQNAFMDALVVAGSTKRNPWFLTRASIFKSRIARFWLRSMRMIAIYRSRDGFKNVKKNDAVIEACASLLRKKESILIFPEANHDHRWSLLPLQKGIARIAFAAEASAGFKLGLKIMPVGVQYENIYAFRSELLINFGQPIEIGKFKNLYEQSPVKAMEALLNELTAALGPLSVNIRQLDHYKQILSELQLRKNREKDLYERLQNDRKFLDQINIKELSGKRTSPTKKKSVLKAILGFPVFIYGAINNILPYLAIKGIMNKFITDAHWISSIRFAGIIFIAPMFYLLQAILIGWFFGNFYVPVVYLLTLPFLGVWAYDYLQEFIRK